MVLIDVCGVVWCLILWFGYCVVVVLVVLSVMCLCIAYLPTIQVL